MESPRDRKRSNIFQGHWTWHRNSLSDASTMRGLENMPFCICSSKLGSNALQCPSIKRQCSTKGAGFATKGGNTLFTAGCIGTESRLPNDASWYGTQHERSRSCVGHGVITIVGISGLELRIVKGSSVTCDEKREYLSFVNCFTSRRTYRSRYFTIHFCCSVDL